MCLYLVGSDGKWVGRSWEDVLQRMPHGIEPTPRKILQVCHSQRDGESFTHNYTPVYDRSITTSKRNVALSPLEMKSYLEDRDGNWVGRSWEDVLQRIPHGIEPTEVHILQACHRQRGAESFTRIYTPAYNSCMLILRLRTATSKEDYFIARVHALAEKGEVAETETKRPTEVPAAPQQPEAQESEPKQAEKLFVRGLVTTYGYPVPVKCCFAMSYNAFTEYCGRHLRMSIRPVKPLDDQGPPATLTDISLLTVLAGESGSGKTTLMLSTGHGLYITGRDFSISDAALGLDDKGTRNMRVAESITSMIVAMLRVVVPDLRRYGGHLSLLVALDEMVSRPNFVRGLCAVRNEVAKRVNAELQLEDEAMTLTFVAAGTGMDLQAAQPGGLPATYRVLTMPASDEMPKHLVSCVKALAGVPHHQIAAAIENSRDAMELAKNPRFAAALLSGIRELTTVSFIGSLRSAEALLHFLLQGAAWTYKTLNCMNGQSVDEVRQIYQSALRLVFRYGESQRRVPDSVAKLLVGNFGVLRDRARWFRPDNVVPGYNVISENVDNFVLAAPPFRFEMSSAQQLLFRMHYGGDVLPDATWWGYEVLVADYLEAALLGCSGSTLRHLLTCLNAESAFLASHSKDRLLNKGLDYRGVVVLRSNRQITSGTSAETMVDIRAHVDQGRAVVVANADKASYADVMLLIPKTAVLLVQCKFFQETTSLGPAKITEELAKLNDAVALCSLAKCAAKSVIRVIATTKTEAKPSTDVNEFLLWTTTVNNSLAPLATALPPTTRGLPPSEEIAWHTIETEVV